MHESARQRARVSPSRTSHRSSDGSDGKCRVVSSSAAFRMDWPPPQAHNNTRKNTPHATHVRLTVVRFEHLFATAVIEVSVSLLHRLARASEPTCARASPSRTSHRSDDGPDGKRRVVSSGAVFRMLWPLPRRRSHTASCARIYHTRRTLRQASSGSGTCSRPR